MRKASGDGPPAPGGTTTSGHRRDRSANPSQQQQISVASSFGAPSPSPGSPHKSFARKSDHGKTPSPPAQPQSAVSTTSLKSSASPVTAGDSQPQQSQTQVSDPEKKAHAQETKIAEQPVPPRLPSGREEEKEDADSLRRETDFLNWLRSNGAEFPDLVLKSPEKGLRGVFTMKTIPANKLIISIPLKCLVTDQMGRTECELGRRCFAPEAQAQFSNPNLIAVVLYILETRRDPNHFFAHYYRTLPTDWSSFPVFWSRKQIDQRLRGSPLIQDVQERKASMRADYQEICRIVEAFGQTYSLREFLEMRTVVGSRNFAISVDGEKCTSLVPFADMLNHLRPRQTTWMFDPLRRAFTIATLTELQPFTEVMDSYGRKDNAKFLLHYGFAVLENRDDGRCQNEVEITLRLLYASAQQEAAQRAALAASRDQASDDDEEDADFDPSEEEEEEVEVAERAEAAQRPTPAAASRYDPLASIKRALLGTTEMERSFKLSMNYDDDGTAEALSFARVVVAVEADLDVLLARKIVRPPGSAEGEEPATAAPVPVSYLPSGRMVSLRNEAAAIQLIAAAAQEALSRYKSSYEANKLLLEERKTSKATLFTPDTAALIVVVGEQEIASFWIKAAQVLGEAFAQGKGDMVATKTSMLNCVYGQSVTSYWQQDWIRYALNIYKWIQKETDARANNKSTG